MCCCGDIRPSVEPLNLRGPEQAPRPPPAAKTVLDLAVMALRLPGGESTAAALLEGLVCLSPAMWFGAALQAALAARDAPDSQDVVMRMLQRLPISSLPAPVAVEAMSQVRITAEEPCCAGRVPNGALPCNRSFVSCY